MTFLFPPIDSGDLKPYAAPLGRLMLGYGRAVIATIVLATRVLGSELKAAQLVTSDSKTLPKRMRKIFRGKLKQADFQALSRAIQAMKIIRENGMRRRS